MHQLWCNQRRRGDQHAPDTYLRACAGRECCVRVARRGVSGRGYLSNAEEPGANNRSTYSLAMMEDETSELFSSKAQSFY